MSVAGSVEALVFGLKLINLIKTIDFNLFMTNQTSLKWLDYPNVKNVLFLLLLFA